VHENTTTLIYHDLQDGGVTIKNAVSRWNLYLIPFRKAGKSVIYQYSLAPYLASVEMFDEIGMDAIIEKRDKITCYLEYILEEISKEIEGSFEIITPTNPDERDAIIRFTSWARSKLV
jgi:selenocysteine lyase/cysteine desulfurase